MYEQRLEWQLIQVGHDVLVWIGPTGQWYVVDPGNHPDGHVEITTQTSGAQVTLTVTNSGPVIPGNQIQRLFQPFQRLAPDRNGRGYGLGLAIVDAVTQAHLATLTTSAQPEGGLSIIVRFAPATG